MKHGHVVHQSVCCGIVKLFVIMVAMDTKLGRIYCTISEYYFIFNSNSLKILPIIMKPIRATPKVPRNSFYHH